MKYDAIIIGGGAAGLMAAITASGIGKNVLLFEKQAREDVMSLIIVQLMNL